MQRADSASTRRSSGVSSDPQGAGAPRLPVVDRVDQYEKLYRVGEGTYGVVYKARDIRTGEIVALKKVRFERSREGVPVTSIRELRVLQQAAHPNIVRLLGVVTGSRADSVFLVFEYAAHDLGRLMDSLASPFSESEVKGLMKQLLEAVAFMHAHWLVHRDLKMSNLLYTASGELKLCDFGLARYFAPPPGEPMTPRVVTLWYRAPELLLGATCYTQAVDCWAAGCIMGELMRHEPLFPAENEADCAAMIARLLGAPSPKIWPAMATLPNTHHIRWPDQPYNYLRRSFPTLSDSGVALLNGLLTYNPDRRLTAAEALAHPWFSERPLPRKPQAMPVYPESQSAAVSAGGNPRKRGRDGARDPHSDTNGAGHRGQAGGGAARGPHGRDAGRRLGEAFGAMMGGRGPGRG